MLGLLWFGAVVQLRSSIVDTAGFYGITLVLFFFLRGGGWVWCLVPGSWLVGADLINEQIDR